MSTSRPSGGLLLAAVENGDLDEIRWSEIDVGGGLRVTVSNDALKARIPEIDRPIRLPASYTETIAICKTIRCIPPTSAMSDAIWAAAAVIVKPRPLVMNASDARQMATVEWSIRHNDAVDKANLDPAVIAADVGKDWILDNGISVRGAVNYGWRLNKAKLLQPRGHMHDASHWDYSQVLRVVQRSATLNGEEVDLLDYLAEKINKRFLEAYR
ncbi:MAG: hypothetical protein ABI134_09965 [Byssovorax sp.]